ncbi:hypothetical protein HK405_002369, partial [Cladochytrium tenue]
LRQRGGEARVAAVGYCFGGRPAVVLSRAGESVFDAFAVAHPSNLQLPADVEAVGLPGLVCLAEDDPVVPPESVAIIKEVFSREDRGRPPVEVKQFLGVRHGYAVRGMMANAVVRKARDQTLEDMAAFFKRVLAA